MCFRSPQEPVVPLLPSWDMATYSLWPSKTHRYLQKVSYYIVPKQGVPVIIVYRDNVEYMQLPISVHEWLYMCHLCHILILCSLIVTIYLFCTMQGIFMGIFACMNSIGRSISPLFCK